MTFDESLIKDGTAEKKGKISYVHHIIVWLATAVASIGLSCSFAYNFAVVCQVNSTVNTEELYEMSPYSSPVMHFSPQESSLLYSAYPLGVFMALIVFVVWKGFSKLSVRWTVFVGSMLSAISTIIIPPFYDYISVHAILPLKIFQGAVISPVIPLIGHVTTNWTPRGEIGMAISILTSYSQIGLFFLMLTSGPLCEIFAWRSIFYANGVVSIIISFVWLWLYRDRPEEHPYIGVKELEVINEGKHDVGTTEKQPLPVKQFFTCASVWACIIAAIGNYNGISPLITFSTLIMKKAINLSDIATSNYNSFSFIVQIIFKLLSGYISDRWTSVGETLKVRLFNTISCGMSGVLMVITAFLPVENKVLCAMFLTATQSIIGFNSAGFNKAGVIVSRQHAHAIVSIFGLIVTFSTVAEPFLVYAVAPESTWSQWFWLFIAHGLFLIISNIIFCIFIDAKPAKFTEVSPLPTQ